MENPESLGNLVAYGLIWAFIALCVFLVARATLIFVAVVAIGMAEKYEGLPGPLRRRLLAYAARRVDRPPAE